MDDDTGLGEEILGSAGGARGAVAGDEGDCQESGGDEEPGSDEREARAGHVTKCNAGAGRSR